MNTDSLIVTALSRQFDPPGGPLVLRRASFTAEPGQTIAIVGPSGSGKSTLLNIIGALDNCDTGSVRLGDIDVTTLTGAAAADYRARHVGFVFQDHHLLPQLTGLENVLLPTLAISPSPCTQGEGRGEGSLRFEISNLKSENIPRPNPPPEYQGREKESLERARELIEQVGVTARANAFPAQLSGGERQRLAIARALINSPKLLLCDEPTGNLDRANALAVVEMFLTLARKQNVIVIMVTHNAELAGKFERCLHLIDGVLS